MPMLHIAELEIPDDVFTLEGFRAWAAALGDRAPLVSFCGGTVYVEMSASHRSHGPLVTEVTSVLGTLSRDEGLGMYCAAPSWFTCAEAGLSTEPDGYLATYETLKSGRLAIHPEREHEMIGRPDMVFEAVSRSSPAKDLVDLVDRYARAGIPEYWIADARAEELVFRILVLDPDGAYRDQEPDEAGWSTSPAWGRAFRLRRVTNPAGLTEFRLDVHPA